MRSRCQRQRVTLCLLFFCCCQFEHGCADQTRPDIQQLKLYETKMNDTKNAFNVRGADWTLPNRKTIAFKWNSCRLLVDFLNKFIRFVLCCIEYICCFVFTEFRVVLHNSDCNSHFWLALATEYIVATHIVAQNDFCQSYFGHLLSFV